jgi:hypothetical protein
MKNRILFIAFCFTILLLTASLFIFMTQTGLNLMKYGITYEVTTMIDGKTSTQTVSLGTGVASILFVFWMDVLLIYSAWKLFLSPLSVKNAPLLD